MSEEKAAAPEAKAAKGGKSNKTLIIAVVGVLVLGGGGFAAYRFLKPPAEADGAKAEAKAEKAKEEGTGVVAFEPFVANLADPGGKRYVRVNVRLIVGNEAEAKEIQEKPATLTRLRAAILDLLTTQTAEQIVTPEGKTELRKAIAEHADGIAKPVEVSDVLFADFVVQ